MNTTQQTAKRCQAAIYDYHDDHACEACAAFQVQWYKMIDYCGRIDFIGLEPGTKHNIDLAEIRSVERVDAPPSPHPAFYREPYRGANPGVWLCHISF